MFNYYRKTHLEDFVEHLYIKHNLIAPEDLTIDSISKSLNIQVEYVKIKSLSHRTKSGKLIILLDQSKSLQQQREDFLHELGHLLRHEGNQMLLPQPLVQYQEEDAEQFVLYALLPFFMIERLELSPDRKQAIQHLAASFSVGTEFASKRYDQMLRREFEGISIREVDTQYHYKKEIKTPEINEIQVHAYYDTSGSYDGPTQLMVMLDDWTLINTNEIVLPIGERLPEVDDDQLENGIATPVKAGDLACFDGTVTLRVHELLHRYGLTRHVFIIHMRDVDMLIARDQAMTRRMDW